jgi:neutral ceramidase
MAINTPYLAGWAQAEITPHIPCPMGGYAARSDPATAIHDPLYAYALALGDPAQPLVVIICDLIGVDEAMVREVRQRIARQFSGANIWLGATHTHSGPDVAQSLSFARKQPDPALREGIIAGACDAAVLAIAAMHPVWVKRASGAINGVGTNRDHPDRDADLTLDMLCFYDTDEPQAQPTALLASFACHPTVMSAANLALSADLPGAYRRQFSALLDADTWICLATGAAGDISTRHTRQGQGFDELERIGALLAQQAYALLTLAQPLKLDLPRVRESTIMLEQKEPFAPADLAASIQSVQTRIRAERQAGNLAQARTLETTLQGLQAAQRGIVEGKSEEHKHEISVSVALLGECALVAVPGELYNELGARIKRAGERFVLLLGYTNGYVGYLPAQAAYAEMDYEVLMSPFAPGAGERLAEALELLLK